MTKRTKAAAAKRREPNPLSRPLNTMDWDLDDVFADARGVMRCRILSWCDGVLQCIRTNDGGTYRVRFEIPETYWLSAACGWRKLAQPKRARGRKA